MNEEFSVKAEEALKVEGAAGPILDFLLSLLTNLFSDCNFSNEQIAAMLERPGPFVRIHARRVVQRELYNQYGAGSYYRYNGDQLVAKLLAAGKKATSADFAALRN